MKKRIIFKKYPGINLKKAGLTAGIILFFLSGVGFVSSFAVKIPDPASLSSRIVKQSTKIYDRTGQVILYEIHGGERRTVVPFADIPSYVKLATLAAEDANFYEHPAFDLRAIARALLHNIFSRTSSTQGGSTITQQLVKNTLLKPERTVWRKVKELVLAVRLEKIYSKDRILEFYLNQIPYGSNAYGIEAASQTFFAKSSKDLTLSEAALLAGLPKAPSYYSPYGNHADELRQRQIWIIDRMARLGLVSPDEAKKAKTVSLKFAKQSYGIRAPHFVMQVREMLAAQYGEEFIESGGLRVITTLDWNLQHQAEDAVRKGAEQNKTSWQASNAALVSMDATNGQILALVGSRDYFETENSGNFNAVTAIRQPGSSFKPFVYLTAFKKGYTPDTVLFDVPTEFNSSCSPEGKPPPGTDEKVCYHPQNYDEKFRGPVTIRQALAQSLNIPSVQLFYLAGLADSLETARAFGITTLKERPAYYGLPLVLGGGGVKLLEMVNAYGAFAQEGTWHKPSFILKVEDSNGSTIEEYQDETKVVFEPQFVRVLNDILSDDAARVPSFRPNGPLTLPNRPVAAKTGTSNDYRDAWAIGYTPSIVTGVWVGNNDNAPMVKGGAGVMAAAPIWNEFMTKALDGKPAESFRKPDPLVETKSILKGQYVVDENGTQTIHTTLHWLKKDDPAGPPPQDPAQDPQYTNWETSVRTWVVSNLASVISAFPTPTPSSEPPLPEKPEIVIQEPPDQSKAEGSEMRVTSQVRSKNALQDISLFWNQELVTSFDPNPDNTYSVFFVPKAFLPTNEIKIVVHDTAGIGGVKTITVLH